MSGSRFSKEEWGTGGWSAVQQLFLYATGQLPRGAKPPVVPEEFSDWPTTILPPMAVGMAYSGWRQWRLEQLKLYHGFGYHGFGPPPAWYHVLRAFRVHDRALRGGLQLAGLATLFYGTHALTAVLRGRRRFWADGLAGGAAVGVVQALGMARRRIPWPAGRHLFGRVLLFALLGLTIGEIEGAYAGVKQEEEDRKAAERAKLEETVGRLVHAAQRRDVDAAGDFLAQLEASLNAGGDGQQERQPGEGEGQLEGQG